MLARKALLVDDSKSARFVLSKLLQRHDFDVEMVDSAEAALDFLSCNKADAIFMDHLMKGMDGLSATSRIKTNPDTAHIPVVMCTSNDGAEYLQEARSHGALGTLIKPPSSEKLREILSAVESVIDNNHTTAEMVEAKAPEQRAAPDLKVVEPLNGIHPESLDEEPPALDIDKPRQELEASITSLIAQKLRKFELALEQQLAGQREELLKLVDQKLGNSRNNEFQEDLQAFVESRIDSQNRLLEQQIGELKERLGDDIISSASVSRQVQEIAQETAISVSEETASAVARSVGKTSALEALNPAIDARVSHITEQLARFKKESASRSGMFAVAAGLAGVAAALAVYFVSG